MTTRRAYERHLDLLLAEELTCNPLFARWFAHRALRDEALLPDGEPSAVTVSVSHDDSTDAPGASGENDLLVDMQWMTGETVRLLVEDKLDAILQPRQIERYLDRASYHSSRPEFDLARVVVVAPEGYLERQSDSLGSAACISIDDIAQQLTEMTNGADPDVASRLRWRSEALVTLRKDRTTRTPDHPPAVNLRNWLIARIAEVEPSAVPNGITLRTINSGWLYFSAPEAVVYKITHGFVDIYLRYIWPDPDDQLAAHSGFDSFEATTDTKGNLILRAVAHDPIEVSDFDPEASGFPEDDFLEGVRLCGLACRWAARREESGALAQATQ